MQEKNPEKGQDLPMLIRPLSPLGNNGPWCHPEKDTDSEPGLDFISKVSGGKKIMDLRIWQSERSFVSMRVKFD